VTLLAIVVCFAAQLFLVSGQLFFKRAMDDEAEVPTARKVKLLAIGIACQGLWFFLWLGLLQNWDLSRIFPFEGLNPLLLVLASWLFLKERLTSGTWVGVALISAGLALVAT
jgi:uncharacterized membrane protein